MVTYEVIVLVEPAHVAAFERYMRGRHIADVLATGCFERATFERSAPGRYRTRYEAPDRPALERYLAEHAPRLRDDAAAHFPSGLKTSREIWEELK
jgi:Domain of unknown function (DUF4286)